MKEDSLTINLVVKVHSDKYLFKGEELSLNTIKEFVEHGNYTTHFVLPWTTTTSSGTLIIEEQE